jgi:hypothetical protein
MNAMVSVERTERDFHLSILGRLLEHLGVQMYKHRNNAIAELIANAWDAGATEVDVTVPTPDNYNPSESTIQIIDNGSGMSPDEVDEFYLVIGRNRRAAGQPEPEERPVMGRKGIGKLAGFGIAHQMELATWREGTETQVALDLQALKAEPGHAKEITLKGSTGPTPPERSTDSGTALTLKDLKQSTPVDIASLHEALARRFSRTVQGRMSIRINGEGLREVNIPIEHREPDTEMTDAVLDDGKTVRFWIGFSEKPIRSTQLRGFTIYARGKTAQAPPFYFHVEGTASGQHGTKYMTGEIEADYLDEGTDDESDLISTDRQEIDWENDATASLLKWGQELTRKAFTDWVARRGEKLTKTILDDPEFAPRVERLDEPSAKQLKSLFRVLGQVDADDERMRSFVDGLIRAFEYRQFHDVVADIERIEDDPERLAEFLDRLTQWKVLESRAILEIVRGRLQIVDKFYDMVVGDAPETASAIGRDNLHDLLGRYPWLLNPDWQIFAEEKRISTQLDKWNSEDVTDEDERLRYDFLALVSATELLVVEIKRSSHTGQLEDLQRLEKYKNRLEKAWKPIRMVFVNNGEFGFEEAPWRDRPDIDFVTWEEAYQRVRRHYEHYREVLEGDVSGKDFHAKEEEVLRTRTVIDQTSYRTPTERKEGLGTQEAQYQEGEVVPPATEEEPPSSAEPPTDTA